MKLHSRLVFTLGALVLLVGAAFADPPSRAVRLKYMSGEVSVQPGGVNDWVAAAVNRPLTTADRVWTDKNARAELGLGSASLRLNAETSMTLTNVNDQTVQVELDQGTLNLHIRHLFDAETYEIDTPNLAFTILKGGDYRFDVDPNADRTYVTVWKGEGEANGQGNGVKLRGGEQASFTNGNTLEHQSYPAPDRDGFDDWCKVRTDREDHAESYRYVSADVVGADDLDQYGTWHEVPSYGAVWVPAVAPGWAPYRYGHWIWVAPWGWTWVDDAPWGFAPCHYGRWVYTGGYWGWAPGPVVVEARPVYAPALVAWVGGPHVAVGISVGGPSVGWFPLGYGEPYVPAYAVSRTYFQQVNVTNTHITNITNVTNNYYVTNNNATIVRNTNVTNIRYVNQNVAGAVTAVPNRAFTNSEPVARSMVPVNAHDMRGASVSATPGVAPERTSVLGMNAGARTAAPPAQATVRPVVSRTAPPPRPVPFEAQQSALSRNAGRPLDAQTEAQIRSSLPAASMHNGLAASPAMTHTAGQPGTPAQPGRPGTPAAPAPANTAARPGNGVGNPENNAPRPGVAQPGMNANQTQPARVVPRPPQVNHAAGNDNPRIQNGNEGVGNPHIQSGNAGNSNPRIQTGNTEMNNPRIEPAAATPPSSVRNVPRPPQAGGGSMNSGSQPRQPVYNDAGNSRSNVNTSRPTPTPAPSRTPQAEPSARNEGQPRASIEPRPQSPRPLYDSHTVHEEQRPQSRSSAPAQNHQPAPSHKETH